MSSTVPVLVVDLIDSSLNYAVSLCELDKVDVEIRDGDLFCVGGHFVDDCLYAPSECFEQGAPILDREGISLRKMMVNGLQ
jgi:hypothetical protein